MKPNIQRLIQTLNLDCIDPFCLCGTFDIPALFSESSNPGNLLAFHQVRTFRGDRRGLGVHFFIDDAQFERLWNRPGCYLEMLKGFDCVLTPDFSMFADMPLAAQIWNHYRKMALGQFLQQNGFRVVPTLNWSGKESFRFCFDGIPAGGTVAVSSVGCCKNPNVRKIWTAGMNEAVRRLKPRTILFYGTPIEFEAGNAQIHFFQPEHLERVRKRPKMETRTQWLAKNPGILCDVAKRLGIPKREWEDFQQEVILRSLELKDEFDPNKAKISTWATGFAMRIGREFRRRMATETPY